MSLYLCIDGGGTKTSAVLAYVPDNGEVILGRGEAGSSNLTSGLDACLSATTYAMRCALVELGKHNDSAKITRRSLESGPISVWAGFAGCGRAPDRQRLLGPLTSLFPRAEIRLSSDAELLTAPLIHTAREDIVECVTLICGTGSLGLRWRRDGEGWAQEARSGGWGSLLDDRGSGWAMGKAAITSVLSASANNVVLSDWQKDILAHFDISSPDDLVTASSRLDPGLSAILADSERKRRIVECTPLVIAGAQAGDAEAKRVVTRIAREVVEILEPLVQPHAGVLVVAGGLGQVDVFWAAVEVEMRSRGWMWDDVVKVPDPAMAGMQAMLAERQRI